MAGAQVLDRVEARRGDKPSNFQDPYLRLRPGDLRLVINQSTSAVGECTDPKAAPYAALRAVVSMLVMVVLRKIGYT
jgi:hypothetical protein